MASVGLAIWNIRLQKQQTLLRSQLDKEKSREDRQFSKECEIYTELWEKLALVTSKIAQLEVAAPNTEEGLKNHKVQEMVPEIEGSTKTLLFAASKYQPFYSITVCQLLIEVCRQVGYKMDYVIQVGQGQNAYFSLSELFHEIKELSKIVSTQIQQELSKQS